MQIQNQVLWHAYLSNTQWIQLFGWKSFGNPILIRVISSLSPWAKNSEYFHIHKEREKGESQIIGINASNEKGITLGVVNTSQITRVQVKRELCQRRLADSINFE